MIGAVLVLLALGLLFVIAIPLILAGAIVAVVLSALFSLVLLPIKAIGWGVAGLFEGVLFLAKAVGILLLGGVLLLLGLVLLAVPLISLAPLLLLGGLVWLAWRMARPARTPARS